MSQSSELVYVVDDDASVRRALSRMFRSAGYDVLAFESAFEFLDRQPTDSKTCLVLDIRMPRMSGLELVDRLKRSKYGLPIVLVTGHEFEPRQTSPPVVACFHKPLDCTDILRTIEQAFSEQRVVETL